MQTFKCNRICGNCLSHSVGRLPIEAAEDTPFSDEKFHRALTSFVNKKCKKCKCQIGGFTRCVEQYNDSLKKPN